MGFLLFAARKLNLKRQINTLNYRNVELNQQQQTISSQIKSIQEAMNKAQNQVNFVNTIANQVSVFNQNMQQQAIYKQFQEAKKGNKELSFETFCATNSLSTIAANATNNITNSAANTMNSVFTAVNNVQLAQLNAKDNQISLELENNESQLNLLTAEYKSVKEAEKSEAQNCASTFGIA